MLFEEKMIIAQHRIPDETTETTQVKELLEPVDLEDAVVTADAAHAQRETAEYIASSTDDGNRGSDYFLFVKGNQPGLQRAIFGKIQASGMNAPDHEELDYGHGRIIKRSIWVTDAGDLDFPHASRVARIRRDRYDITGALISKEIVHAITSLDPERADPARLAVIARGQRRIESAHWLRSPPGPKTPIPDMPGTARRSWPLSGTSRSACSTTPASPRSPGPSRPSPATGTACSDTCRYETGITNDFADPVQPARGVWSTLAVIVNRVGKWLSSADWDGGGVVGWGFAAVGVTRRGRPVATWEPMAPGMGSSLRRAPNSVQWHAVETVTDFLVSVGASARVSVPDVDGSWTGRTNLESKFAGQIDHSA